MSDEVKSESNSEMQVKFRVIALTFDHMNFPKRVMLFSTESYKAAEDFCWRYPEDGSGRELNIEKVWVKKGRA